uniref:Uncharacterized protein n=1 Tax=Meloidogyne incognita TaxID=6306 RepID=A0A914M2H0_MELIC
MREELFSYIITFRRHHPPTTAYMLYSIGRFLRRTIPSPWNHSRRNCLAAPSGVLVHSTVTRSLLVASAAGSKASQEMAMLIASFGSRTPLGGSMFRRRGLVVLNAKPIRCPPELMICVLVVERRVEDDLHGRKSRDVAGWNRRHSCC